MMLAGRGDNLDAVNTAKKVYESDDHGVVHVDVPVGRPGQRVEVLVVWAELDDSDKRDEDPAGMADLVGLLDGSDLERPEQPQYEQRDSIA